MCSRLLAQTASGSIFGILLLWVVGPVRAADGSPRSERSPRSSHGESPAPRIGRLPTIAFPQTTLPVRGYVPAHQRPKPAAYTTSPDTSPKAPSGNAKSSPEIVFPDDPTWGEPEGEPSVASGCLLGGELGCDPCCDPCWGWWQGLELLGGTQGFTGPANRGETGSFGFHEGVNWGAPLPCFGHGMWGMQFGMRATHSNLSGSSFTAEERQQIFVTGGVFRRVDWGFQAGVVLDYLHEDWYLEADLVQLRGEVSWLYPCHHEIGFWFTANTQKDTVISRFVENGQQTPDEETFQATDLFAFFYRYRVNNCGGATGRLFAGFTGAADGLLGADIQVPINDSWAFQTAFTYLVPDESNTAIGHIEEAWNFGISLAWRPAGGFLTPNYYRPLLSVADNGTFMVDRR